MKRHATAVWKGTIKEGKGAITTQSGTLKETPYTFRSRFGEDPETNPEELVAAAHSGCYSMALSLALTEAGFTPDTITTKAIVSLDQVDGGFSITTVNLELTAKIPGIDQAKFEAIANGAKAGCPVSKVLNAKITLTATLEK